MTGSASLIVERVAVRAEPVSAGSRFALPCRNVAARRAGIIVVIDPMLRGLLDFVDGVKRGRLAHMILSFWLELR